MTTRMARLAAWGFGVAWWLCVSAAPATDYYIDATHGGDANDGKTEATAWQRLARIGQAQLKPGDRILLKRGGLWKEPLPVPASGTGDQPITYTAYGKGDQPKIVAEQHAVEIARKSGITLEDLDITGYVYTIFIHAREGEYSGFVFRNCRITSLGGRGQMPSGHCIHQASEPIITEKDGKRVADEGSAVFKNLVVSGCTLTPGRQGWANGINLHNNVTDFTIENNVIGPAGEDAILLWNCKRGRVTGNTCGGNGENSIDIKNSSDVTVSHNTCTNDNYGAILLHEIMFLEGHKPNGLNQRVVIEHNVITGAGQCFKRARSAPEITAGIWLSMSDDCIVRYNRLVDCLGIGIEIDDAESSQNNNQVYGNVIVGAGAGQLDWCAGIFLEDCVGTKVFNNLICNQKTGAGISLRGGKNTEGIQVLNNIVTLAPLEPGATPPAGPPALVKLRPEAGKGLVCDYNCYWPNPDDGFRGSLPGKANLARGGLRAWQDAFQMDVHSLAADPKLKDPANGDFTLTKDSPCVGQGTKIDGYTRDAAGITVPQGPAPDIGPYELSAAKQ